MTVPGARILLVEDDPRVRTATVGALEDLGYEPVACSSGAEALALFDSMEFDLVISDVIMPEMTGPEMVREMQVHGAAISRCCSSPAMSARARARIWSAIDLLRKPFTVSTLSTSVAAALARRAYRIAPDRRSRGSRLMAASSGCRFCQGLSSISVPAWRLIFHAIYSAPPA